MKDLPKTYDGHRLGEIVVKDHGICKIVDVDGYAGYTMEMIMPKEVFIEAYNKYIKDEAVEPERPQCNQIAWEQGFEAGLAQGKAETRPQGEWYYGEDECGQDGWFCSECNFFVPWYYQYYEKDINFIRDYKACPHCLAEMVTYTGKDRDTEGGAE